MQSRRRLQDGMHNLFHKLHWLSSLQLTRIIECFARAGQRELIGYHQNSDVLQNGTQVHQASQTTQGTGRSSQQPGHFVLVSSQGRLIVKWPGHPVDRVFHQGCDAAVVFGCSDQQSLVIQEQALQFHESLRRRLLFQIFVEQRKWIFGQIHASHRGAGLLGGCHGHL